MLLSKTEVPTLKKIALKSYLTFYFSGEANKFFTKYKRRVKKGRKMRNVVRYLRDSVTQTEIKTRQLED